MNKGAVKAEKARQTARLVDRDGRVMLTDTDRQVSMLMLDPTHRDCPQCQAGMFQFMNGSVTWECLRHGQVQFHYPAALMIGLRAQNQLGELIHVLERVDGMLTTIHTVAVTEALPAADRLTTIVKLLETLQGPREAPETEETPQEPAEPPSDVPEPAQAASDPLPSTHNAPIQIARR